MMMIIMMIIKEKYLLYKPEKNVYLNVPLSSVNLLCIQFFSP